MTLSPSETRASVYQFVKMLFFLFTCTIMTDGKACGKIKLFKITYGNCILVDSPGLECVFVLHWGSSPIPSTHPTLVFLDFEHRASR